MNASFEPSPVGATGEPGSREIPLQFSARGGEYFRIWIVNLLLTLVTLGIYSAWAKVRTLRYLYGNTSLDGSGFEYHGRPIAILKGRIVVAVTYVLFVVGVRMEPVLAIVMLPVVIFGLPWVVMRSRLFQMRMSAWRNLRFNFHGTYGGALGAFVGWPLLGSLTLGILYPFALWKQSNYLLGNTAYGTQRFTFNTTVGRYYIFCLASLGILVAGMVVLGIVVAVVGKGGGMGQVMRPGATPREVLEALFAGGMILTVCLYLVILLFVSAYYRVSLVNAGVGGTAIGPHLLYSRMKAWPFVGIALTNLLAMVVTLGLFYPWARVRSLRYQLANTGVIVRGDLNQFVADTEASVSAVGDAASDFFNIDFGF